jgi:hypothetical protein
MTFEEPLLEKAQKDIEATEKLCGSTNQSKMFSSFRKAFKAGEQVIIIDFYDF